MNPFGDDERTDKTEPHNDVKSTTTTSKTKKRMAPSPPTNAKPYAALSSSVSTPNVRHPKSLNPELGLGGGNDIALAACKSAPFKPLGRSNVTYKKKRVAPLPPVDADPRGRRNIENAIKAPSLSASHTSIRAVSSKTKHAPLPTETTDEKHDSALPPSDAEPLVGANVELAKASTKSLRRSVKSLRRKVNSLRHRH